MLFSRKQHEDAYPAVPDSLRADSAEMPELRKIQQARADTSPSITPYLGLRARLSQLWFNRWTILLLLVLLRVLISVASVSDDVDEAKVKALSACTKVEDVGSAMASMPHYLSVGVNEMSAKGIEKTMDGLIAVLGLLITGVQELIIFVINMVTSMYTCLILAFIESGLEVAAHVTEKVTDAMNSAIGRIADTIGDRVESLENGINKVKDVVEDSFIGGVFPDFPDVDFSGPIEELRDIDIDASGFVSDINQLNEDLPSFREVQNMTAEAISIPFKLLRQAIDEEYKDFRFDRSVFPVAEKQALDFCSKNNNISDFFDGLRGLISNARLAFIIVLAVLAALAIVPMAWYEIMQWRRMREHARIVGDSSYDSLDVIYIASRPTSASWGIRFASRLTGKRQVMVRWAWAYMTSTPALFVLALALAGFFACACQAILLKVVQDQVPEIAGQVGEFADEVVTSLKSVSQGWADDANGVVLSAQDDVNNNMLGWARDATGAVNDTLNTFVDKMNHGLETVFNDTILIKPIQDVIFCTIGLKIEAVQKGLTRVHDHAKVSFPTFANDTFSAGAEESVNGDSDMTTFLATPSSVTTDEVTGALQHVIDILRRGIITEALISTGILLIYVIVVLVGMLRALVGMAAPGGERGHGPHGLTGDNRAPMTPRTPQAHDDRFPRFGSEVSGPTQGYYAEDAHGEKHMASVPGGVVQPMQSPKRASSYGQFESPNPVKH